MSDESKGARTLTDAEAQAMAREIPMPPAEFFDELDNAGGAKGGGDTAAPAKPVQEPDYVDGPETVKVELRRPFRFGGAVVVSVHVRPLSVAETGTAVVAGADVIDFYALMTGLPAPLIRGLRGDDGQAVVDACYPFLPRFMRTGGD